MPSATAGVRRHGRIRRFGGVGLRDVSGGGCERPVGEPGEAWEWGEAEGRNASALRGSCEGGVVFGCLLYLITVF